MKHILFGLFALVLAGSVARTADAAELMIAAAMQRCATNEECTLVTNSCADNCAYVPVNKGNIGILQSSYQNRCGKPMDANPVCNMVPPVTAACISNRCTIDYGVTQNAAPADYKAGAYSVPEEATPSAVPAQDYSHIDDRHGFTAYNLPQNEVKQKTVGTLYETVYVPPSAPVSGANYTPVAPAAAPAVPAPVAPAPQAYTAPPVYTPSAAPSMPSVPAPVVETPAYVPPAPVYAPATTPAPSAPVTYYVPPTPYDAPQAAQPVTTPVVPPMPRVPATPAVPSYAPPAAPAATTQTYIPATVPAYVPPTYAAPAPVPPQPATTGLLVPVPPSDLKPAPTYVPPTGASIPVAPGDPGAPPPAGSTIMLPVPTGMEPDVPLTIKSSASSSATPAAPVAKAKSFAAGSEKSYDFNQ